MGEPAKLKRFEGRRDKGQGMLEYVLIIVLVSVSLIVALTLFGGGLGSVYGIIVGKLP